MYEAGNVADGYPVLPRATEPPTYVPPLVVRPIPVLPLVGMLLERAAFKCIMSIRLRLVITEDSYAPSGFLRGLKAWLKHFL